VRLIQIIIIGIAAIFNRAMSVPEEFLCLI